MNVVIKQILFEHLARGHKQVAVAALAAEFKGALRRGVSSRGASYRFHIRDNRNLKLALDLFHELGELRRCAYTGQFCLGWHGHISFEGNMILGDVQSRGNSNRHGTYQEHGRRDLNLTFWSKDSDYIGRSFLVGESNPATGFVLDVVNEDTFVPE